MRVFVVIPAYNEGPALGALVQEVSHYVPAENIVVVDDGSVKAVHKESVGGARLLRHHINLGKGMALKTGCEFAQARKPDAIVLMDGDGQHEPREIPRLVSALEDADIAFAARELDRQMPPVRMVGNWTLNRCASLLFRLELSDVWCGFRAFRADALPKITWNAHDYAVDVEMAVRAWREGLVWREVPIGTVYHDTYKGVTVVDGLRLLGQLVSWKFTL